MLVHYTAIFDVHSDTRKLIESVYCVIMPIYLLSRVTAIIFTIKTGMLYVRHTIRIDLHNPLWPPFRYN